MYQHDKEDVVPVESDKPYEELVDPDVTGEPAERGERPGPNEGETGLDPEEPVNFVNDNNLPDVDTDENWEDNVEAEAVSGSADEE